MKLKRPKRSRRRCAFLQAALKKQKQISAWGPVEKA
jgi:hypothetical protein